MPTKPAVAVQLFVLATLVRGLGNSSQVDPIAQALEQAAGDLLALS